MIFNTIHHDIRNKAGLSILDYCLLESIYLLSNSPNAKYTGWCNAAKEYFAYLTSDRNLRKRYNYLVEQGYMEFKDSKRRMLKRTTKKYYNEVYSYVLGEKKLGGNKVPSKGGTKFLAGGNKVPDKGEQSSTNRDKDIYIDKDKTKGGVIPLTKEQLRAKQFKQNVEQVEFPSSWSDGLIKWVKRYMEVINEEHTNAYYSPKHLQKTVKQIYNLQAHENRSAKYIADLISLCAKKGWRSIYSSYLEDATQAKVLPKFQRLV